MSTMTESEARELRAAHDADARGLNARTKGQLARIYAHRLAERGHVLVHGGPQRKDEYISAILNLRYPIGRLNEAIHVLHHAPGENWSACEWCHPHGSGTCECRLGRAELTGG